MCGRVKLEGDFSEIKIKFSIPPDYPTPNLAPSWNVAPTDSLPIVRYEPKGGHRTLDLMRWGLVPYWAKDIKIGFSTINAQAETVDTKPAFRDAFKRRRCLAPIEACYEWKKLDAKNKQPYAIALADRGVMALAGLWENWKSPAEEWMRSWTPPRTVFSVRHERHFGTAVEAAGAPGDIGGSATLGYRFFAQAGAVCAVSQTRRFML